MEERQKTWKEASRSGKIVIRGTQRDEFGQSDTTEVTTTAKFVKKDNRYILFYREYMEEGGYQQVRLTIEGKDVILKKTGLGVSELRFRKGASLPCHYMSPIGPMELVSKTRAIRLREGEHSLTLKMEYTLYMNGQAMSDYDLEIRWTEQ